MKRIKDFFSRLRFACYILTHRRHYFYVDFTETKTAEDTLRSAAFLAALAWFNSHDPMSARARTEMLLALLDDSDTLMLAKRPDGSYLAAYACDTPETLRELRSLDFEVDVDEETTTNTDDHGADEQA